VIQGGNAPVITATGSLGAKDEVMLSFKIGGIVARVLVDDGATVRRGQVLAVLDQREIEAVVARATAVADKARRDAARAERLFRDSVVTLAQMQDAQTGRTTAEADLRTARVNHEFATIVAPADGVVLMRAANPGQLVGPGAPVIQFASRARGSVLRAGIPDRDVVNVRLGAAAQVSFDAVPGKVFQGRVSQVGASADPRTGLYTVEVALEGVAGLPSGLVGKITIGCAATNDKKGADTGKRPGATRCGGADAATSGRKDGISAIPAEALVEGDGDRGVVYTIDASGKRARRLAVTLVGLDGDNVLVRGLDGVTRVVSAGATWLTDSAKVEIKP
jgi:RND family efflux transporter MFP subunit